MDCWGHISLVHDSSIVVVTSIWYSVHPTNNYQKYNSLARQEFELHWQELEDTVVKNLKSLNIPHNTKNSLFNIAQPIGREIKQWLEFHAFLELKDIHLYYTLVWESPGTIDWKTSAEKIVSNKSVCVVNRFRVACINCLEAVIHQLWPEVRFYFYDADNGSLNCTERPEIMFWLCHLEDKFEDMLEMMESRDSREFIQSAAWSAVLNNNLSAAKYFIEQLEPQDSAKVVKNSVNYLIKKRLNCNSNLLAYLLSILSKTDQKIIIIAQSENLLLHFLNWPLQNLFLELVGDLWKALSPIAYYNILEEVIRKASEFHHGEIYRDIFEKFWDEATLRYKCYVVHKCINGTFLSRIFSLKYTDDFIKRIIEYSTTEQRMQMLMEFNGMQIIDFLIGKHRWNSLLMFIKVCISKETNLEELREAYIKHVREGSYTTISKIEIQNFNEVLDGIQKNSTQTR